MQRNDEKHTIVHTQHTLKHTQLFSHSWKNNACSYVYRCDVRVFVMYVFLYNARILKYRHSSHARRGAHTHNTLINEFGLLNNDCDVHKIYINGSSGTTNGNCIYFLGTYSPICREIYVFSHSYIYLIYTENPNKMNPVNYISFLISYDLFFIGYL